MERERAAQDLSTSDERGYAALENAFQRLDATARADSTVGTPREAGESTIVPLAEVWYGGGFGLGGGTEPDPSSQSEAGYGGGGGFGGRLRPVAVVEVGPSGARVRPVLDYTALGLGILGLGLAALIRMPWRKARRQRR